MKQDVSNQQASTKSSQRWGQIQSLLLWTIQGLLALLFLLAGSMKLLSPIALVQAQMPVPLPGLLLRFVGAIEVAGALGLIVPGLTRIKPFLTPLAACGLAVEMGIASIITVIGIGISPALFPLIVGVLSAFVASRRRTREQSVGLLFGRVVAGWKETGEKNKQTRRKG